MINFNEQIAKKQEEIAQLKRQQKLREKQKQEAKRKADDRRKYKIGELVADYFPEVLNYQPCRTTADTDIEFAAIESFISTLAADIDLVEELKLKASLKTMPGNKKALYGLTL